jgi:NAD+ kinase
LGLALGGDGTYLETVRLLNGHKVPIIGVNLGSLGFLTVVPRDDLYAHLMMALEQRLEMRPRSMLDVRVKAGSKTLKNFVALNDVVLERGSRSHLIYFGLSAERQDICDVKADGVIIASPTGSTAYNLAAGGPILHPETRAFVITPICPHSLTNRPMIFPDSKTLHLRLRSGRQTASLTIDGQSCLEVDERHEILIQRARQDHYVLRPKEHNYFKLLADKLKFAQRA